MEKDTVIIHNPTQQILNDLESAYAYCVNANKTAALSNHTSLPKIGHLLDVIEELFEDYGEQQ